MAQRWYHSRTNQAALIGAAAVVVAAVIAAFVALHGSQPYPTIEVKDLSPNGEQVLARLAISPTKQLLDSVAFAAHRDDNLLWNDSLGVAIRKPVSYEWGTSPADSLETVSGSDEAFVHWLLTQIKRGFNDFDDRIRFFAVRLDQPTRITITSQSLIDSTVAGYNPFRDVHYFLNWMRANYGPVGLAELPKDSVVSFYRQAVVELDSFDKTYYPLQRRLLTGVFVARVRQEDLATGMVPWAKAPLLDRVVASVAQGSPNLLVIDRDRGSALFSTAVQLRNILIDGKATPYVTLNRAGYAVQREKTIYVVMLQYLSSQPHSVLEELQRIISSVRLRTSRK